MGMHGPEFFETGRGRTFLDGTMPKLIRVLERIADHLDLHQAEIDQREEAIEAGAAAIEAAELAAANRQAWTNKKEQS